MTSSELGLDIKKTLLSKTTLGKVSGVDKTLQKAAKNYLLLGKISHNLNLINQNIINLVRAFGIEAREKEDAHFLKENEREINFRVRREKYIESKVKKVDPDGTNPDNNISPLAESYVLALMQYSQPLSESAEVQTNAPVLFAKCP